MTVEDAEIVTLYFERRESAIFETHDKYGAYLNTVAYNILRSYDDTEEIMNDTYLAAWNAIPPARPQSLKHFLSRITRNLSFNRLDFKNAGKRRAFYGELDECIPDTQNDMEAIWDAREIGRVLNEFLRTLDNKTCAIFLGRYYYAHTVRELAALYGLPERRVKYLLEKSRRSLRCTFEKEGVIL
jgi:RNA polymerase sigma-70 factor (ECF subfamily)